MANKVVINTELDSSGVERGADEIQKDIDAIIAKQEKLQAKMDKFLATGGSKESKTYKNMSYDAEQLLGDLYELEEEMESIGNTSYVGLKDSLKNVVDSLRNFDLKATMASVAVKALKGTANIAKSAVTGLAKGLQKVVSTLARGFISGLKKAGSALLSFGKSAKGSSFSMKDMLKNLMKYGLGVRSLFALVNKLRGALMDGLQNLAQFNDGMNPVNASMSRLKSGLTQLKNSLASAFAPILTTIEPILTRLIDILNKAITAVGMFFGALAGQKTFTKAVAVQENYAESLDKTAKKAKKAKTYLSGLDEVRTFTAKDDEDDSSSKNGGVSPNQMFEQVPIDSKILDFANKVKEMLKKIKDMIKAEKFEELGFMLAEALANALDKIPWQKIQEKCMYVARALAEFLNGVFANKHLWSSIGHTIAEALNTIILTALEFITTFKWREAGDSIGVGLNQMISDIRWAELGKLFSEFIKGILEFVVQFVETMEWYKLGQKIGEMLANIDWGGCISLMFEAIGAALGGLFAFLYGLIEPAWTNLKKWWHDTAYEDGKFTIKGLLDGILDALKNIWSWIKEHIFTPIITGFEKAFGIASPSKVMYEEGGYIMQGLLNSITDMIEKVIAPFITLKDKIVQKIQDIKTNMQQPLQDIKNNFIKTFEEMKKGIEDVVNGIIGVIEGMINKVVEGLNKLGDAPRSALSGVASLAESFGADGVASKISSINIPKIPKVNIPRLATGTVVPRQAGEFLAMLGDNNRESEVVSPLSTIKQALAEVMAQGGYGSKTIKLTGVIDRRVLFEEMVEEARMQSTITGSNPFEFLGV